MGRREISKKKGYLMSVTAAVFHLERSPLKLDASMNISLWRGPGTLGLHAWAETGMVGGGQGERFWAGGMSGRGERTPFRDSSCVPQ